MSKEQHFYFAIATALTLMAPALTLPCLGAWLLMAWLGRAADDADVSTGSGCGATLVMILFVGLAALLLVIVGGATLEGRL